MQDPTERLGEATFDWSDIVLAAIGETLEVLVVLLAEELFTYVLARPAVFLRQVVRPARANSVNRTLQSKDVI